MTATPWGFRDILPEEAQAREEIALTVKGCFRVHHYLPVETPLLEDKGSLEEGGRIADTPCKLFDDDGRLLVVRPDNTLPIVRLVSTRMRAADLPLRLRYEAPVVRECQRNAGGSRQFTQLGFELIGAGDTAGDVEIVSLVAEAVRKLALPDARSIAGSVRPFKELLAACEDRELAAEALRCVHANDFVGLDARVAASAEPDAVKAAVSELPRLHGGADVLERVDALLAAVKCDPMPEPTPAPTPEPALPVGAEGEPFFGEWHGMSMEMDGETFSFDDFDMVMDLTLIEDGTAALFDGEETDLTSWKVEDGVAIIDTMRGSIQPDGSLCLEEDGA